MSSDLQRELQQTLGSTYLLERELGGGGMSRVFLATEPALRRRVVVKVLAPELAMELSGERFSREILLAAALQHPHIVPVLAAGESQGIPFYTMPFVEGESLRARLQRGPVPQAEAVGVLRDVALALEHAHAHGVVHRDIKPENILLAGRTAVVADFGIAKAVSDARAERPPASGGTLTSVGQSLGTPAYMAPEQVAADVIDHRTDLYAWGVVAYELLAGRHPFADKASSAQLMAAHLAEIPAPLAELKPALPPPLASLVMSCLAKAPADRPASAGAVVEALESVRSAPAAPAASGAKATPLAAIVRRPRAAIAVALAVAALGTSALLATRSAGSAASEPAPSLYSIAVLPFESPDDTTDAYFADGITDAVRGKLSSLPGLSVIARASSSQYLETTKGAREIAKELGVRYLLSGTVRFAAVGGVRHVQVSPELIEVSGDGEPTIRWQEPFDAEVHDVFRVQGDIAGKVAEKMRVTLAGVTTAQLAKPLTADPVAYDAYLRGEAAWSAGLNNEPQAMREAIRFLEQAVARDSTIVDAWGALARARSSLYYSHLPTRELAREAQAAAASALALDPVGDVGHRAMGIYLRTVANDFPGALRELELARRAAPNDAYILSELASAKSDFGRHDEALRDRELALQLDPRNARLWGSQAQTLIRLRRYDEAIVAGDRALMLAPGSSFASTSATLALLANGDLAGARRALEPLLQGESRTRTLVQTATGWDRGWMLDEAASDDLLRLTPEAFGDRSTWAIARAQQYHWRGDSARARAWGDTAAREHLQLMRVSDADPQVVVLHGLSLALAGQGRDGVAAAARGVAMARSPANGGEPLALAYYVYVAARTAMAAGDREAALRWLEESIQLRYYASPAWIRLEPTWKPLHGDPRFEALLARS